jgi:LCP family protein required for cell wall assembly
MSEELTTDYFRRQADEASEPLPGKPGRSRHPGKPGRSRRRRRKLWIRLAVAGSLSLVLAAVGLVGASYLVVNHIVSSIHRIPGIIALDAKDQPAVPAGFGRGMTVLLTGSAVEPADRGGGGVDGSSTAPEDASGLIALIHLNASQRSGAVVNIPADALVYVPGYGRTELSNTLAIGGPSLLIETVERLTNVRIDHYSVLDFSGVNQLVGALNGVDVDVPYTVTSMGVTFPAGEDQLTASDVLAYVRQPGVSEIGRELLQSNLIRAILDKLASTHDLSHFGTDLSVLDALASVLSVDSNFTDSQLESLALHLGNLSGRDGVFVTAPTAGGSRVSGGTAAVLLSHLSRMLWEAIRHDSVAQFAQRFPFTLTPIDPG